METLIWTGEAIPMDFWDTSEVDDESLECLVRDELSHLSLEKFEKKRYCTNIGPLEFWIDVIAEERSAAGLVVSKLIGNKVHVVK